MTNLYFLIFEFLVGIFVKAEFNFSSLASKISSRSTGLSLFLVISCILQYGCASGVEPYKNFEFGEYKVTAIKEFERAWIPIGYTSEWALSIDFKRARKTVLDTQWATEELNLGLRRLPMFVYLERSRKLVLFFQGFSSPTFMVGVLPVAEKPEKFFPVVGATDAYSYQSSFPENILRSARTNRSQIFWGVPDSSVYGNELPITDIDFYRKWGLAENRVFLIDYETGNVYPRNIYLLRHRRGQSLIPIYPAFPNYDPGHPANEQIRMLSERQKEMASSRMRFDFPYTLGMVSDRKAIFTVEKRRNGRHMRACIENLGSSAWHCVTLISSKEIIGAMEEVDEVDEYDPKQGRDKWNGDVLPNWGVNFPSFKAKNKEESLERLRTLVEKFVKPVSQNNSWNLLVNERAELIDEASVN